MFHLSYTRTLDDYRHYYRLLTKRMQRGLLRGLLSAILYPLTIFYLFLLAVVLTFQLLMDGSMVLLLAAVVVGAGLYASALLAAAARIEYLRPNGPFTGPVHLTADDRVVSVALPLLRQELEWSAIESVSDAGCVILWIEPTIGEYIPERAFTSPQHRASFVAFASAHLASSGASPHGL
jgi:hypothetical protein